jgi:hypothetical protein
MDLLEIKPRAPISQARISGLNVDPYLRCGPCSRCESVDLAVWLSGRVGKWRKSLKPEISLFRAESLMARAQIPTRPVHAVLGRVLDMNYMIFGMNFLFILAAQKYLLTRLQYSEYSIP